MKKLLLILITSLLSSQVIAQGNNTMSDNESIIREFVAAWSNLNAEELAGYFASDGVYHNMPSGPVSGRENIQEFIAGFIRPWQSTDWEILNLLVEGDRVMVERLDKTVVNGQPVDLPCLGFFELEGGKIKLWRDYFDLATYTEALGAAMQAN